MELKEQYNLPFESNFDWRVTMFQQIKNLYIEALIDEISKFKIEDFDLDYKDEDAVIALAIDENLFEKINERFKHKVVEDSNI